MHRTTTGRASLVAKRLTVLVTAVITALVVTLVVTLVAPPAHAGPEDPPIVAAGPANGATVPVSGDGIAVVYTCPGYHSIPDPVPFGTRSDYGVRFATSPALGADGRLADANVVGLAGPDHVQDADLPADHCRGYLTGAPASTPGTYYWQAYRICTHCPGGYESGPVQSFTLTLSGAGVGLTVSAPRKLYVGIPVAVTVRTQGLGSGSTVAVEAQVRGRWKQVGQGTVLGDEADVVVKPRRGTTRLRATFTSGETLAGAAKKVKTVRATTWPRARTWRGAWSGDVSVSGQRSKTASFDVVGSRPLLRNGAFTVTLLCPTPGQVSPFTIQVARATVRQARIAPDGRFAAAFAKGNQSVLISGRLSGSRARGEIHMTLGTCAAGGSLDLRHD